MTDHHTAQAPLPAPMPMRQWLERHERQPTPADEGRKLDWWNPDPGDPFWMLEIRQGFDNSGAWLKNHHSCVTTRDAAKALRFPSRSEADRVRRELSGTDSGRFEPTEHLWINHKQAMGGDAHLNPPNADAPDTVEGEQS